MLLHGVLSTTRLVFKIYCCSKNAVAGGVQYEERTLTVSMEPFRYIIYIELSTMKSNTIMGALDISGVIIHALAVTTTGELLA